MRLSKYFLPVLKEDPKEAQIVSHRLMLRAGMIRQLSAGIYNWLPLGLRVLKKIENIVREEMDKAGAIELLMPTIQPAELWKESGRGDYGPETLCIKDRHGRDMIYGPTNEEVMTDLFRRNITSYKELPKNLYHIQWKFRDEIRPRFGVMRGREFLMKDAYTFTVDEESHIAEYYNMYRTYLKIFRRMDLITIPFKADTGLIGGDLSHEFQVIANTGESQIYYDPEFENLATAEEPDIEAMKKLYSAADEKHDPKKAPKNVKQARGIEVGHIFYFDTKYSEPMGAKVTGSDGKEITVKMGAHGIGISRLVGAIIEASHDDKGIIWPESVAPFKVGIINLKSGDAECDKIADDIYGKLQNVGVEVLYDDRQESAGNKFATMDLIGIPYHITIGPRGVKAGKVEFKNRKSGEKTEITAESAIEKIS